MCECRALATSSKGDQRLNNGHHGYWALFNNGLVNKSQNREWKYFSSNMIGEEILWMVKPVPFS